MKKKLLLVDDDLNLRNLISEYLSSEGFYVDIVSNVYSALIHMKLRKPDLIIADIMMPGLNGHDFIQMLRLDSNFKDIPLIFLSAKGMTKDRIKGYDLGCNAYLTKPFDPSELVAIINNIFNNSQLSQVLLNSNKKYINLKYDKKLSIDDLTYRERTVLKLVAKGYRNKDIAINLNLSIRNVEKYVSLLLNKTDSNNRTALAQLAMTIFGELIEGE